MKWGKSREDAVWIPVTSDPGLDRPDHGHSWDAEWM